MVYMGSKARFAKYIIPIINSLIAKNNSKIFIDGFMGGANIIANPTYNIECKTKYGFDNNKYLIALLNHFKDTKFDFIEISEDKYKHVRDNKDSYEDWFVGYVGFLFTFGGKFFNGYGRELNKNNEKISIGKSRYNNLYKQYESLQNCTLFLRNFFDIKLDKIKPNTLIYLDPPYQNTTKYGKDYNIEDYDKFWNLVRELSKKCIVVVSEYTAPDDFETIYEHYPQKVLLDSKRGNEGKETIEKLFVIKNHWWKD